MIKAILFHTAATAIMAYGYLNLKQLPVDKFINTQKGGHSQFLTIIGCVSLKQSRKGDSLIGVQIQSLWMACANMTLGLVSDLLPTVACTSPCLSNQASLDDWRPQSSGSPRDSS